MKKRIEPFYLRERPATLGELHRARMAAEDAALEDRKATARKAARAVTAQSAPAAA